MKKREKKVILSASISLLFLFVTYLAMNCRWSVSGEKMTLKYFEIAREWLFGENTSEMADSVLFVNVHHDKKIVMEHKVIQENGIDTIIPKGEVPVTDRQKLYQLLYYLKETNNYRYIILDVALDKDVSQQEDMALYQLIGSMDRIVLPIPISSSLADSCMLPKAGVAQYGTTIWENDFVKYPYIMKGVKSMPLKMYEELTGRKIEGKWPFFHDGLSLVRNSVILTFELKVITLDELEQAITLLDEDDHSKINKNIAVDLGLGVLGCSLDSLEIESQLDEPDWANNKYVLIGDYESDRHSTFRGDMAGTVILFNAYLALLHGHHRISFILLLVLFGSYFVICWLFISNLSAKKLTQQYIDRQLQNNKNSYRKKLKLVKCVGLLCSWLSYPGFLVILCLITYFLIGEVYDVLLAITLFFILKKTIWLYRNRNRIYNFLKK